MGPPSDLLLEQPVSSQELSALLLALSAWPDETQIRVVGTLPSRPYVELTRSVLAQFGASVGGTEACWSVRGPLRAPADPVRIEPDASAAAVLLAAAVVSEGEVRVEGLGNRSAQGDWRIVEFLQALGGECSAEERSLLARGRVQRAACLSLQSHPDLAPVLAGVGAAHAWRGGEALRMEGLGTLPHKESSRIEVLARGFRQAGLEVAHGSDWMQIGPRLASAAQPVRLDPAGDHRMVFAFALLGLVRPDTAIAGVDCVRKSWPGFFEELCRLGARLATR
jgi:3-phosphoshikimate 1-carboxyvinyltransferase